MSLPTQLMHVRLEKKLLSKVDTIAARLYITRSEFIRQAMLEKARANIEPGTIAVPNARGIDILMTDRQLDELWEILRRERLRRAQRALNARK